VRKFNLLVELQRNRCG